MTQNKKENILFAQKKKKKRIMAGIQVATVGRWACFQQKAKTSKMIVPRLECWAQPDVSECLELEDNKERNGQGIQL